MLAQGTELAFSVELGRAVVMYSSSRLSIDLYSVWVENKLVKFLNESFTILFYTQIYMCLRPQWTGGRGWVRLNHTIACVGVCNPQDNSRRPLGRSSTEGP